MKAIGPGKRLIIKKDRHGTHYKAPQDGIEYPEVHAWWCREPRARSKGRTLLPEYLCIKQINGDRGDVIMLSPGQVYDMIDALTHAVEHT